MPGVDPDQIDAIALHLGDIYREAELAITRDVADHLRRHPGAPTAYADGRLASVRALRASVAAVVAALEADGSEELRRAVADGYRLGTRSVLVDIPRQVLQRPDLADAAEQAAAEVPQVGAVEALAASLVSDVGAVTDNLLRQALDAYREAGAGAVARMLTTGETRREASAAMWANLTGRGILGFVDRAGRRWRLSTYVEMAVRTSTARAAVQGQTDRLDTLGIPLVYVSDHGQECPRCRPFEGKVLRIAPGPTGTVTVPHALTDAPVEVEVVDTLAGARLKGLHHPNCKHSVSAFLPGVTRVPKPDHDPAQYDQRMEQRRLEREIRKGREQEAAGLTDQARNAAGKRVRQRQAQLREHLDAHPYLKRLRYRERVGAGSTPGRDHATGPAASIGPDVETTLDGDAAPFPVRLARRPDDTDAQGPADVDAAQLTLDDAPAAETLPDPPTMTGDQLDAELAELMAAGDYDSPRMVALMAEMDRRDQAGTDHNQAAPVRAVADMSDDELAEEIGTAYAEEDYDRAAEVEAELERRDQATAAPAPAPAPPPAAPDLTADDVENVFFGPTDAELDQWLTEARATGHAHNIRVIEAEQRRRVAFEEEVARAEFAEEERRRVEAMTPTERARHEREERQYADIERLVSEEHYTWEEAAAEVLGTTVESVRRQEYTRAHRVGDTDRRDFRTIAREQYREEVARQWLMAEDATNGYLLTPAAQAAGIDPQSLFSGPRTRAEKWASEELKRWWDQHGRTTFEEFVESIEQGRHTGDPGQDYNR